MARHEPWLGGFISCSLAQWLRSEREDRPSDEYHFDCKEPNLTIRDLRRPQKLLRVLKSHSALSRSGRVLETTVSDGKHHIDAVFLDGAAARISHICKETTPDFHPTVAIRVKDPLINVNVDCDPPRVELHIRFFEALENDTIGTVASTSTVLQHEVVRRSLADYRLFKRGNCKGEAMTSSPQSVKSQAGRSPVNDRNMLLQDDMPVSQLQFCTQVHNTTKRLGHDATSAVVASDNGALLELLRAPTLPKKTTTPESSIFISQIQAGIENSDSSPAVAEKPAEVVHAVSEVSSKPATPVDFAPPHKSSTNETGLEDFKQVKEVELVPNSTVTRTKSKPQQMPPTEPYAISAHTQQNIPAALSKEPPRPFQRWRREAQAGRYVPRYIEVIPKDQEDLLISDDSWQPSLVGHPMIPGQVPTPLLQQLSDAADDLEKATVVLEAWPSPHGNEDQSNTDNDASKDGLSDSEREDISSQTDSSPVAWSQSPTPQKPAMQFPPNSPPLLLHQHYQTMKYQKSPSQQVERSGTVEVQSSTPNAAIAHVQDDSMDIDSKPGDQAYDLIDVSTKQLRTGMEGIESTFQNSQIQLSTQQDLDANYEQHDTDEEDNHPACSTDMILADSAKIVQVKRTPYCSKGLSRQQPKSAISQNITQLISPGFIPGSFPEIAPAEAADSLETNREQTQRSEIIDGIGRVSGPASQPQKLGANSSPTFHAVRTLEPVNSEGPSAMQQEKQASPDICTTDSAEVLVLDRPTKSLGTTSAPESGSAPKSGDIASNQDRELPKSLGSQSLSNRPPRSSTPITTSEQWIGMRTPPPGQEKQSRLRKEQADVQDVGSPSKRSRKDNAANNTHNVLNEAYAPVVQKVRDYRRETLSSFVKRRVSVLAASSPPDDSCRVGDMPPMRATPTPEPKMTPIPAPASKTFSSTPVTRISTYDELEKTGGRTHGSQSATPKLFSRGQEILFLDFQTAYPDYKGTIKDFISTCRVLNKILSCGQGLHPSLYDDAIFHHYHSYRPYLSGEALNSAVPLPFYDFYNERVENPSHSQRLVTRSALATILGHGESSDHAINNMPGRHVGPPSTSPVGPQRESWTSESRTFSTHTPAMRQDARDTDLPDRPTYVHVVEKGRREASEGSGAASPELGTPEIDRSSSDNQFLDMSGDDDQSPASASASASTSMGPPRRSKKRSLPWDPELLEVKNSMKIRVSLPSTPQGFKRRRLSASPFVKAATTTPVQAQAQAQIQAQTKHKESSRPGATGSNASKWWTDKNTPFKRFADGYSKLESHSNKIELDRHNIGRENSYFGGGIDLFSWRR